MVLNRWRIYIYHQFALFNQRIALLYPTNHLQLSYFPHLHAAAFSGLMMLVSHQAHALQKTETHVYMALPAQNQVGIRGFGKLNKSRSSQIGSRYSNLTTRFRSRDNRTECKKQKIDKSILVHSFVAQYWFNQPYGQHRHFHLQFIIVRPDQLG